MDSNFECSTHLFVHEQLVGTLEIRRGVFWQLELLLYCDLAREQALQEADWVVLLEE